MNHPLGEDLTKLAPEDLDKKHTEILKRYNIARRMNMPLYIIDQLDLLLSDIENERYHRLITLNSNEDPVVIDTDRVSK